MNCEPGDLAVAIRHWIVDVEEAGRCTFMVGGWLVRVTECDPATGVWRLSESRIGRVHFEAFGDLDLPVAGIGDSCLRPIRDQPGEDQVLTRVGKPQEDFAWG